MARRTRRSSRRNPLATVFVIGAVLLIGFGLWGYFNLEAKKAAALAASQQQGNQSAVVDTGSPVVDSTPFTQDDIDSAVASARQEMKVAVDTATQRAEELQTKVEELEGKLDEAGQFSQADLDAARKAVTDELTEKFKAEIDRMTADSKTLSEAAENLRQQVEGIPALTQRAETAEAKVTELQTKLDQVNPENQFTQAQVDQAVAEATGPLNTKIEELSGQVTALQNQVDAIPQRIADARTEGEKTVRDELQPRLDELTAELAELNETRETFIATATTPYKEGLEKMREQIAEKEQALLQAQQSHQEEIAALTRQNSDLQSRLKDEMGNRKTILEEAKRPLKLRIVQLESLLTVQGTDIPEVEATPKTTTDGEGDGDARTSDGDGTATETPPPPPADENDVDEPEPQMTEAEQLVIAAYKKVADQSPTKVTQDQANFLAAKAKEITEDHEAFGNVKVTTDGGYQYVPYIVDGDDFAFEFDRKEKEGVFRKKTFLVTYLFYRGPVPGKDRGNHDILFEVSRTPASK